MSSNNKTIFKVNGSDSLILGIRPQQGTNIKQLINDAKTIIKNSFDLTTV